MGEKLWGPEWQPRPQLHLSNFSGFLACQIKLPARCLKRQVESLTPLKAESPKSRCRHGHALFWLLVVRATLAFLGFCVAVTYTSVITWLSSLGVSVCSRGMFLPMCVCLCVSSLSIKMPVFGLKSLPPHLTPM